MDKELLLHKLQKYEKKLLREPYNYIYQQKAKQYIFMIGGKEIPPPPVDEWKWAPENSNSKSNKKYDVYRFKHDISESHRYSYETRIMRPDKKSTTTETRISRLNVRNSTGFGNNEVLFKINSIFYKKDEPTKYYKIRDIKVEDIEGENDKKKIVFKLDMVTIKEDKKKVSQIGKVENIENANVGEYIGTAKKYSRPLINNERYDKINNFFAKK